VTDSVLIIDDDRQVDDVLGNTLRSAGVPEKYTSDLDRTSICGVVQKPVESAQLTALLQRCMERERR